MWYTMDASAPGMSGPAPISFNATQTLVDHEDDRARLAFSHVFRSREFKSQSDPDEYGSVSLTVAF